MPSWREEAYALSVVTSVVVVLLLLLRLLLLLLLLSSFERGGLCRRWEEQGLVGHGRRRVVGAGCHVHAPPPERCWTLAPSPKR